MKDDNGIVLIGKIPPPYGGVSIYNANLINALNEQGIPMHQIKPGFQIFKHRKHIIFDSFNSVIENPTLINLVKYFPFIIFQIKWIKVIHDGGLPKRYSTYNWVQKGIVKIFINRITQVICVNDQLGLFFKNKFSKSASIIESLLPFNTQIESQKETKNTIKKILNNKQNYVLGIGVFTPYYGFHQLIEAINTIRNESHINLQLVLVDGGFVNDAEYQKNCIQNKDWITIFKEVPPADVQYLMQNAKMFVRSVSEESVGLSKMEALYMNCPVISTNSGYVEGVLTYEYGDIDMLKKHIQSVLDKPKVKINAKQNIEKRMNQNLNNLIALINDAGKKGV